MSTLDDLRAELAARLASEDETDIEAGQAAETARTRADQTQRESSRLEELARETARPFAPTSDVKKLFRKLAQKIHPDRARSEPDRAWRTQLMSEANRAYQAGDESALLEVLALWQEGNRQQPLQEDDRDLLASQLARLKRRIAAIEGELNRLFGSRLYELFTATHIARRTRRDLLQEMADRLDADIAMARTNLA
jgi:succinylglutamate desuccinylase